MTAERTRLCIEIILKIMLCFWSNFPMQWWLSSKCGEHLPHSNLETCYSIYLLNIARYNWYSKIHRPSIVLITWTLQSFSFKYIKYRAIPIIPTWIYHWLSTKIVVKIISEMAVRYKWCCILDTAALLI